LRSLDSGLLLVSETLFCFEGHYNQTLLYNERKKVEDALRVRFDPLACLICSLAKYVEHSQRVPERSLLGTAHAVTMNSLIESTKHINNVIGKIKNELLVYLNDSVYDPFLYIRVNPAAASSGIPFR